MYLIYIYILSTKLDRMKLYTLKHCNSSINMKGRRNCALQEQSNEIYINFAVYGCRIPRTNLTSTFQNFRIL